jgi:hypothetical protein
VHESDSFISEVSEEVRRDRLYRFLRRWGWLMAAAIVVIVGGAAANEWRKARAAAMAAATGEALRAAFLEDDPAARAERLAALAVESASAGPLVRLAEAGSLFEAGDRTAAAATLSALAEDAAAPEIFRNVAALQRVMMLGSALVPSERLATLEARAAPGAPFRARALEQRALAYLDAGDNARAQADLLAVLTDPESPEGVQARAQQLLIAAGGELSVPGMTGAAAPADG